MKLVTVVYDNTRREFIISLVENFEVKHKQVVTREDEIGSIVSGWLIHSQS